MANEIIEVSLETGQKRVFAVALRWPGWCRGGRDEAAALQALVQYGPRYARAIAPAGLDFRAPSDVAGLSVVERLAGNATTDFGAPAMALPTDREAPGADELARWEHILAACWQAFDAAAQAAAGRPLSTGPRGGGRDLEKIVRHVLEVDAAYLNALGGKPAPAGADDPAGLRAAILAALGAAARGEIAAQGPRGGARWAPRYFVRRLAWHVLDHAWEIEDRANS